MKQCNCLQKNLIASIVKTIIIIKNINRYISANFKLSISFRGQNVYFNRGRSWFNGNDWNAHNISLEPWLEPFDFFLLMLLFLLHCVCFWFFLVPFAWTIFIFQFYTWFIWLTVWLNKIWMFSWLFIYRSRFVFKLKKIKRDMNSKWKLWFTAKINSI